MHSAIYGSSLFRLVDNLAALFESTQTKWQFLSLGRSSARAEETFKNAAALEEKMVALANASDTRRPPGPE